MISDISNENHLHGNGITSVWIVHFYFPLNVHSYSIIYRRGKTHRSSTIALGFFNNAFLIFLDNDTQPKWYELLHNDAVDPFTMDQGSLVFDDKEHACDILQQYKKHHGAFDNMDEAINSIKNAKEILTGTCGDFGFIIGGDHLKLYGRKEEYTDEDI